MSTIMINRRLEGKVAIITGGASGIGASTVCLFWEHGAKVVIADIQDDLGKSLADKLLKLGGGENVIYVHCDVSVEEQIVHLVDTTISKFGHLDIMYNNAGIIPHDFQPESVLIAKKSNFEHIMGVNLVGGFLGAKHAARVMVPNKKGCILFTASACTEIGGIATTHAYATSKHGIVGLAKSLAIELGVHGIRVNCISPFAVLTGRHAGDETMEAVFEMMMNASGNLKGRFLKVEDVAKAALYLAGDDAGYVSGINLMLDGGYSLVNPTMSNALTNPISTLIRMGPSQFWALLLLLLFKLQGTVKRSCNF